MKIFALYLTVHLTKKPAWLDDFLNKYHEPVDLHITLLQSRYVNEDEVKQIEELVARVLSARTATPADKEVYFSDLVVDEESDGTYTFMLNASPNAYLEDLQNDLRAAFEGHTQCVDELTREYEENFIPHITIAANVTAEVKEEAEKYITEDYECAGVIESLVLPVVNDVSLEQRTNRDNLIMFKI